MGIAICLTDSLSCFLFTSKRARLGKRALGLAEWPAFQSQCYCSLQPGDSVFSRLRFLLYQMGPVLLMVPIPPTVIVRIHCKAGFSNFRMRQNHPGIYLMKMDCWTPSSEILIQWAWGGAWELMFLTSSQAILIQWSQTTLSTVPAWPTVSTRGCELLALWCRSYLAIILILGFLSHLRQIIA